NSDGTRLASAGNDNCVIIWEPESGQQVRRLNHANMVWRAIFSPDGQRLATCSDDGTIRFWDWATGIKTLTLRGVPLSFRPDRAQLASGSEDGTIRIWDARPWTPEAAVEAPVEREALGQLDYLFKLPLRKRDVVNHLAQTNGITPQVRQKALSLVDRYHE